MLYYFLKNLLIRNKNKTINNLKKNIKTYVCHFMFYNFCASMEKLSKQEKNFLFQQTNFHLNCFGYNTEQNFSLSFFSYTKIVNSIK